MRAELMLTTQTLLNEIADKNITQKSVALTYRLAMLSSEKTDGAAVNKAIVDKWSVAGLNRIKKMAWKGV